MNASQCSMVMASLSKPYAASQSRTFGMSCSSRWQAMLWPPTGWRTGGGVVSQISPMRRGQRLAKTQPFGGSSGLGMLPARMMSGGGGVRIRPWRGGEQRGGVGMVGRGEDDVGRAVLDDAAEIHDGHLVGHVAAPVRDRGEMSSSAMPELSWRSPSRLTMAACTETSSAETGSSAMHQLRLAGEGAGERDALALAARELVRHAAQDIGRQAHALQQPDRLGLRLGTARGRAAGAAGAARRARRSGSGSASNPGSGTPSGCGASGRSAGCRCRRCAEILPAERGHAVARLGEARQDLGERRLAAAGLADDGERAPAPAPRG